MSISNFQVIGITISCQFYVHVSDVEDDFFSVSGGNTPLAKPLIPSVRLWIVGRWNLTEWILKQRQEKGTPADDDVVKTEAWNSWTEDNRPAWSFHKVDNDRVFWLVSHLHRSAKRAVLYPAFSVLHEFCNKRKEKQIVTHSSRRLLSNSYLLEIPYSSSRLI